MVSTWHIWSDDNNTNDDTFPSYNGQFPLYDGDIDGTFEITHHSVDDATAIPFIYPGVDTLLFTTAGVDATLVLPILSELSDAAAVLVDAACTASDIQGHVITYGPGSDGIDTILMDFTGATTISGGDALLFAKWPAAESTLIFFQLVAFNNRVDQDVTSEVIELNTRYTNRPDSMEVWIVKTEDEIPELVGLQFGAQVRNFNNRTLMIPMHDTQLSGATFHVDRTSELWIRWTRHYAPAVSCPMTNQWTLQFKKV